MSGTGLALALISAFLVLVFLYVGTFVFLFLERFVHARVEHRDGPGMHGSVDAFQVWKDFQKVRKKRGSGMPFSFRFRLAMAIWKFLPAVFLLVLLAGVIPAAMQDTELPLLLLLPLLAATLEAVFLHATTDSLERVEWRKRMYLRIMGASVLALAFLSTSLAVGIPSLEAISRAQGSFPYLALFSSPGLLLCGLTSVGAIFLFAIENPIQNEGELSLGRSVHYSVFFVRRMWIFCLLCFWVFVFFGGASSVAAKVLFPVKVALALFLFTLLQESFPRIRSADAGELAIRWLFRLGLLGILVEAIWVGVGR
jgi:NADH:ubiquinone oxidoreductase subunit H